VRGYSELLLVYLRPVFNVKKGESDMKVYTADADVKEVQRVLLRGRDVTNLCVEVSIWPGPAGWGIGSVVLFKWPNDFRHYGIVKVELIKKGEDREIS